VLERTFQAPADQPRVKGVVAVLDEHGAVRETQKRATRVLELGSTDEHRAVDVVALARVWIDGRAAVDERVEEGERAFECETLRPDLEHQERSVASRLHIERDELGVLEGRARPNLRRVDRDLFPRHRLGGPARLQEQRFGLHRASARARRAHAISSRLRARSRSTAAV
jgi:hypothetical protein